MINNYNDNDIQVLEGLEAVRLRPGMYIGNTNQKGLHHLIWEIVDNAIDESLAGFCSEIKIIINKNEEIIVEDNGRGIPVGMNTKSGKSTIETVFTILHAGGKFNNDNYKVSGGLHGVGASVVNALSKYLYIEVYRDGFCHEIKFHEGGKILKSLTKTNIIKNNKTGTRVLFKPDDLIFKEGTTINLKIVEDRVRQLAYLNKKLKISLIDERINYNNEFYFEGGIKEYIKELTLNKEILFNDIFYCEGNEISEDENKNINVEISLSYVKTDEFYIISFCNNINTIEGGTHEEGFKIALTRIINNYAIKNKIIKNKEDLLIGDDLHEGLYVIISIKHPNPQYEGQTKGKLSNSDVRKVTSGIFNDAFERYLLENPQIARLIVEQGLSAAHARIAAKKAREISKRKNALEFSTLPGKLADCASKNAQECELYLVEGDSAGGSAKLGRDRYFQAILPLKGKIINVEKATDDKILKNNEIENLITAIGTNIKELFSIENIRYNKIIIMTDADVDGAHIRILLLTFFFRYMKKLITNNHIYIAQPPLYKIEYKNNKETKYFYSDQELNKFKQEELESKNYNIQRYKGLGEMNPQQLWETTMDPQKRTLIKINIGDAIIANETFNMLMGQDVEPRKKFIHENARFVEDIDI